MHTLRCLLTISVLSISMFAQGIIRHPPSAQVREASACIGIIHDSSNRSMGTGFIVGKGRLVVTCAHVSAEVQSLFHPVFFKDIPVTRRYSFSAHDISVFELPHADLSEYWDEKPLTPQPFCSSPAEFGDIGRVRPGDFVHYLGWDRGRGPVTQFHLSEASVSATGLAINDDTTVEFIEFEGVGVPGWSGGPVFDSSGRVVAIMREAWLKQGIKGGPPRLMNRAFSIGIVRSIEGDMTPKLLPKR